VRMPARADDAVRSMPEPRGVARRDDLQRARSRLSAVRVVPAGELVYPDVTIRVSG